MLISYHLLLILFDVLKPPSVIDCRVYVLQNKHWDLCLHRECEFISFSLKIFVYKSEMAADLDIFVDNLRSRIFST
jgi:hypothetical protein